MPSTSNKNIQDVLTLSSEGRFSPELETFYPTQSPVFIRMIVLDVIMDPNNDNYDNKKKVYWGNRKVSNSSLAASLPRNTIVAKKVGEDVDPMFVFPFFPSHLSMPCKPGECVWAMLERPEALNIEMAYWFCRAVEIHQSDDVNHTHMGRYFEISSFPGTKEKHNNEKEGTAESGENVWHELRNSPVKKIDDDRVSILTNLILRDDKEDIFEKLVMNSDASNLMVYESIPRFRKRPGDIALEGSNNTLIVLGTDRKGPAIEYANPDPKKDEETIYRTKVPKYPETDLKKEAGSIDIVAGRGQIQETYGTPASTTSIKNAKGKTKGQEIKKELNKSVNSKREGDIDYLNDRSRILVSQRTKIDNNFGLKEYNEKLGIKDGDKGDSAIVVKSDKIRLIARSDLEILVTNYTEVDSLGEGGTKIKKDIVDDPKKWASITIKTNGDIVFKPSDLGYIKLGGEDAKYGIVCTDIPVNQVNGSIAGPPIQDNFGSVFAGASPGSGTSKDTTPLAPGHGKFASKVLIK